MNEKLIPLSVPNISGNELAYVTEAVRTEWVSTAGGSIVDFEEQFAAYLGVAHSCACQSGTAGLHLCLRHYGIGQGDIVIVPTLTFIATINAVSYQMATPVFFDCDDHLCIDVDQVRAYLEQECTFKGGQLRENQSGAVVKAIIPVHVFGDTCQMDTLMDLAGKFGLVVIEDATESLGTRFPTGRYQDLHTGTVGHAGVFSFNGNKIITTGGGGMIVSHDQTAIRHMQYLSQQAKDDVLYFVHNEVGFNYRMTNLQAALGLGQLERLDEFIETKRRNYKLYQALLADCPFGGILPFYAGDRTNYWFYSFAFNEPSADNRDALIQHLNQNRIQARPVWKLNHTQKPFANFRAMPSPKAAQYYDRIVNLPCSSNLCEADVHTVCETLLAFKPKSGNS